MSWWKQGTAKSPVFFVAVLLLLAGFFSYRNFTKGSRPKDDLKIESPQTSAEVKGSIAGGATSPEVKEQTFGLGAVAGAEVKNTEMKSLHRLGSAWQARRIDKDSLKGSASYEVQKGDTLWEIARGKYGSGSAWHKILTANKDKIGRLPNGSPALIRPGQKLVLP